MKKFLSVIAVVALVFALAVPAFAADAVPSITFNDDAVKTESKVQVGETTLDVVVETATITETQESTLTKAVESLSTEDVAVVNVVDVTLQDEDGKDVSEDYFNDNKSLKVAFTVDQKTQKVVAVLYWNEADEKWDSADFTTSGDKVNVTFKHLCEVAFVMADVETDPTVVPGDNTGNTGSNTSDAGKTPTAGKGTSPQTGYDVIAWSIAVSALVMAAGYCFVSARKVTE